MYTWRLITLISMSFPHGNFYVENLCVYSTWNKINSFFLRGKFPSHFHMEIIRWKICRCIIRVRSYFFSTWKMSTSFSTGNIHVETFCMFSIVCFLRGKRFMRIIHVHFYLSSTWKVSKSFPHGDIHVEILQVYYPSSFLPLFHIRNFHVIFTWKYPRGNFLYVFYVENFHAYYPCSFLPLFHVENSTSFPRGNILVENSHVYYKCLFLICFRVKNFHVLSILFLHMINFTNFIDRK